MASVEELSDKQKFEIQDQIKAQGDIVRQLKQDKADKSEVSYHPNNRVTNLDSLISLSKHEE